MGNSGSIGVHDRRRNSGSQTHPPPQPEIAASRYVFAAATPHANSPPYYQYPGYYPHPAAMPFPMPAPYNFHHLPAQSTPPMMLPPGYVEHQKAVTIRNDVNVKKEKLRIEPDDQNPGKYLVSFSFDAAMAGRVTLVFFAKEADGCHLTSMKESSYPPITFQFEQGLGQKFKQPSGSGIDLSTLQEGELPIDSEASVYPLAVKAEASLDKETGNLDSGTTNSQITLAVFQMDKGEYQVKVVKQILWVNGMRYELQEIYGIGNTVEDELDGNDPGKDCVVCLSEPRDTTVLPCRHMCMCSECAKVLRFQTNRCPICRQPVERLLEIKVHNGTD